MYKTLNLLALAGAMTIGGINASDSMSKPSDESPRKAYANRLLQLPDEKILRSKFHEGGLDHFLEKTNIAQELANCQLFEQSLDMKLTLAISDHLENLTKGMPASEALPITFTTRRLKPMMIAAILNVSKEIDKK